MFFLWSCDLPWHQRSLPHGIQSFAQGEPVGQSTRLCGHCCFDNRKFCSKHILWFLLRSTTTESLLGDGKLPIHPIFAGKISKLVLRRCCPSVLVAFLCQWHLNFAHLYGGGTEQECLSPWGCQQCFQYFMALSYMVYSKWTERLACHGWYFRAYFISLGPQFTLYVSLMEVIFNSQM